MTVDYQALFNVAFTISAFLAGWVLNNITKTMQRLDNDVRALPMNYVSKADFNRDIDRVLEKLDLIFDKLDGKADKP